MIKRLSIVIAILFILLMINAGFSSAITGAMGNARMILYPEVNGLTNTIIEKSILTKNVNDVPINITLKLDKEGEKFLELIDKSFILEPHTEKKAQFIVKVKDEGDYKGKINVFFSPLEDQKTGVALSSEIIVIAKKDQKSNGANEDNFNFEDENTKVITGDVVNGKNEGKKSPVLDLWLLIGAVFVLLLILVFLIIVLSKKGEKRRNKVNGRKKI